MQLIYFKLFNRVHGIDIVNQMVKNVKSMICFLDLHYWWTVFMQKFGDGLSSNYYIKIMSCFEKALH